MKLKTKWSYETRSKLTQKYMCKLLKKLEQKNETV